MTNLYETKLRREVREETENLSAEVSRPRRVDAAVFLMVASFERT